MPDDLRIDFGADGNSEGFVGAGWSKPEREGCWATGPLTEVNLGLLRGDRDYSISMSVHPFIYPDLTAQRVSVRVNDRTVASLFLKKAEVVQIWLPGDFVAEEGMNTVLSFKFPDAARPVDVMPGNDDGRVLALSFQWISVLQYFPRTTAERGLGKPSINAPRMSDEEATGWVHSEIGIGAADLAVGFESFGDCCEFGFVQRRCGAEPLSLFRFSNPSPTGVLRGLKCDFADLGVNARVVLDQQRPRREWIVEEPDYHLLQHTFIWEGDQEEEIVAKQQLMRFQLLKRKTLEDINEASKIFVMRSVPNLEVSDVLPIARTLRAKAASNWLLYVVQGTDVGKVEVVEEGLLRGTIDRLLLTGEDPRNLSLSGWLSIMVKAWKMVRNPANEAG